MPDAQGNALPGEEGYVAPATTGGILQTPTATQAATPAPAQAVASTPQAVPFTVPTEATVASNVKDVIAADSPLMQQAATRAAQQMNARGLLNSSQAIGATQAALYDAALPIAQSDAATRARAAENTFAAKNAAELQRANAETSTSQFNVNNETTRSLAEKELQNKVEMQKFELAADLQKIHADGTIRQSLVDTEARYKMLMQTSAGAADLYRQSIANFAAIISNPDIADKAGALNLAQQQLNDALAMLGDISNLDLGSYLTFDIPAPAPQPTGGGGGFYTGLLTNATDATNYNYNNY